MGKKMMIAKGCRTNPAISPFKCCHCLERSNSLLHLFITSHSTSDFTKPNTSFEQRDTTPILSNPYFYHYLLRHMIKYTEPYSATEHFVITPAMLRGHNKVNDNHCHPSVFFAIFRTSIMSTSKHLLSKG